MPMKIGLTNVTMLVQVMCFCNVVCLVKLSLGNTRFKGGCNMINPNINKFVTVVIESDDAKTAIYQGVELKVHNWTSKAIKAGVRRLRLKFSICSDSYYLCKETEFRLTRGCL
jgi:hypothetical protein